MVRRIIPILTACILLATAASSAEDTPAAASAAAPATAAPTPGPGTPGPGDIMDVEPFEEETTVEGTIEAKLEGVWLLVAQAIVATDKFKNFVQLVKIAKGEKGLEFHILDVRLPDSVEKSIREANRRTLKAWVPSADVLAMLKKDWSKLPQIKQKARDEFLYFKIAYVLASADRVTQAFPQRSEKLNKVLEGAKLGLKVQEDYRPRPAATTFHGSQVARRLSFYGIKSIEPDLLKGDMMTGFIAMGTGMPIPLDFSGAFQMYRVAAP